MGQYYKPVIIYPDDSKAVLNSYHFTSGAKLTEHSWIGNELVNAVYSLIHQKPRKVAWIGDYANDNYLECGEPYTQQLPFEEFLSHYEYAWRDEDDTNTNIPSSRYTPRELSLVNDKTKGMCLINHNLREYLDLGSYIKRCTVKEGTFEGFCMDPLPMLTACGNDRGGGDFRQSERNIGYELVGIWAFHQLELNKVPPGSYAERSYTFMEGA